MYTIENWSCFKTGSEYTAPECRTLHIQGYCPERSKELHNPDGKKHRIVTSAIEKVDGCNVITRSGTHYFLGRPDPAYLVWLKENKIEFDPNEPIKVRKICDFLVWP